MGVFKSGMTFNIGISPLWQRRYHSCAVHKPFAALCYIHSNPVRKGLVAKAEDYPWSSACGKWDVSDLPMWW